MLVVGDVKTYVRITAENDRHIVLATEIEDLTIVGYGSKFAAAWLHTAAVDFKQNSLCFGGTDNGFEVQFRCAVTRMTDDVDPWIFYSGNHTFRVLRTSPAFPTECVHASNAVAHLPIVKLIKVKVAVVIEDIQFGSKHHVDITDFLRHDVQIAKIYWVARTWQCWSVFRDTQVMQPFLLSSCYHFLQGAERMPRHDAVSMQVKEWSHFFFFVNKVQKYKKKLSIGKKSSFFLLSHKKTLILHPITHHKSPIMIQETPVLLLTGYLGSGKTTLVNKILSNRRGIKFAVIVNDIGEVNIDADLIERGGVVDQKDDSLVALQNGCICCTLKMDLVGQLHDILKLQRFDYIVIEASGICDPGPIAQTICTMPDLVPEFAADGLPRLDCIATVVDALRLKDEFAGGNNLLGGNFQEDDIESLVIQQIEFCNIILLNKASEVTPSELERTRQVIRAIQPKAEIIECDFCDVDLDCIVGTGMFNFDEVATSAAWIHALEHDDEDEHDHHHHHDHDHDEDEHEHHHDHDHDHHDHDEDVCPHCGHHHGADESCEEHAAHCDGHHHHHEDGSCCCCGHHHHGAGGHMEEFGISTFVYYRREPFNINEFDQFVARLWPKEVIRAKGICYFADEQDSCYLFEQAGRQVSLRNAGQWYATMPADELETMLLTDEKLRHDWDDKYGDRMQKLVFIGQKMDREAIETLLDACLVRC